MSFHNWGSPAETPYYTRPPIHGHSKIPNKSFITEQISQKSKLSVYLKLEAFTDQKIHKWQMQKHNRKKQDKVYIYNNVIFEHSFKVLRNVKMETF